ncbi:MAG: hypothetical protein E6508_06190 [Veillonella sp.]|uniref:hypothetical protein n=1 Tax=Veillonella sp. TaxID=1926307 RepID=UPI00290C657A|nr:hypothetical protein [Veillonella sp.]MDU6571847.1 hypothetical protein [Veillonella sp.]
MPNYEPIITSCIQEMQAMALIVSSISIVFAITLYVFTHNGYISLSLPFIANAVLLKIFTDSVNKNMCKKFHVE